MSLGLLNRCYWFILHKKTFHLGAIWGLISKAKNKGETCHVYAQKYGSGFETRDIATLYIAYERELKKLNLVVRILIY